METPEEHLWLSQPPQVLLIDRRVSEAWHENGSPAGWLPENQIGGGNTEMGKSPNSLPV